MEKELEQKVLQKMNELFISKRDCYIEQKEKDGIIDYVNSNSYDYNFKLTDNILLQHIRKRRTIGIFSVANSSKVVVFDIDENEKSIEIAQHIIAEINKLGIGDSYIYKASSGNKGLHLYLFLDNLCWQSEAKLFFDYIIQKCKYQYKSIDYRITDTQGLKLPLSYNKKNKDKLKSICWFLDDEFNPIFNYEYFLNIKQFPRDYFKEIVSEIKLDKVKENVEEIKANELYYKISTSYSIEQVRKLEIDGLQKTGTRNESCVMLAKLYNTLSYTYDEIVNSLNDWMYKQNSDNYTTKEEQWKKENVKIAKWVIDKDVKFSLGLSSEVKFSKEELIKCANFKDLSTKKLAFGMITQSRRVVSERFYFTVNDINKKCDISNRTANRARKTLLDDGFISITNLTKNGKQQIDTDESTGELIFSKYIYQYNFESDLTCAKSFEYNDNYVKLMIDAYNEVYTPIELRALFGRRQYDTLFTSSYSCISNDSLDSSSL